jgi:hypothetical protein
MVLVMSYRVTIMLLLVLVVSAPAQRIERVEGSRFESEAVVQNLSEFPFENLSFSSSQYIGGILTVQSADLTAPRLTFRKIMNASSMTQAEDFAKYLSVQVEELENELSISAEAPSRPPWSGTDYSGKVDLLVEIPPNENLKIYTRTSAYSISVTGPFASVDITNEMGPIEVTNISRKVKIACENGAVRVDNCDGPVTVRTSLRPISLSNVDSKLGTVKLRNTNGKISLESIKGEIDARTDFATIEGAQLVIAPGRSKVRTENSNIKLETLAINGDLLLMNSHGKVELVLPDNTSAQYSLQVDEGGRIYTSGIPITAELVKRTLLSGYSGDKKNQINVDMRGVGTISLVGVPPREL